MAGEEAPQRADAEAMPALGELRLKLFQRDVAGLFDERKDQALVRVDATPVDDAPRPVDDRTTAIEDHAAILSVNSLLANDSDPDGRQLRFAGIGAMTGGVAALDNAGNVVFTPTADFNAHPVTDRVA